jgi:hypothetical protein
MAGQAGTRESVARLIRFPVAGGAALGAWIGFAIGLLLGTVLGAVAVSFARALVLWVRDLSYSLGVAQDLLPLGDQVPTLEALRTWWFVFIPAAGLVFAVVVAAFGAAVGALLAVAYNHLPMRARFTIELDR